MASPQDAADRGRAWTVRAILAAAAEHLASRGIQTARLDAERMLAEILGTERLELYLEPERAVTDDERSRFRELVRRRAAREPAQHILGTAEFYGLRFKIDTRALIPRRETELLVDRAREIASGRLPGRPPAGQTGPVTALDLGTGCGCIAAALAGHLPEGSFVWATDVSKSALDLARENVAALGLAGRVELREGDLFEALGRETDTEEAGGVAFDLIVANLPYIESGAFEGLDPEVRDHEPRVALDGGADGLDVIKRAAAAAPARMAPGAWLLVEVGFGQAEAVTALLREAGLEPGPVLSDAANVERVVQARKPGVAPSPEHAGHGIR